MPSNSNPQSLTRGIPEVPTGGDISPELRRHLVDMRQTVLLLRAGQTPPGDPGNVRVTAQAFGNIVQWSRGQQADFHEVLWNTTPTIVNATVVNVGNSAQWTDNVGQMGVKRYYWVRSHKNTGPRSREIGPKDGTTLASNAGVAPPPPPPPGTHQVLNQRTGGREPL